MKEDIQKSNFCDCDICKDKIDFTLPKEIIESLKNGKLVIFAGAGVSTENRKVFPYTLYDDIKADLDISDEKDLSFSELMSIFCKKPNGRINLLLKIKERFDYIKSFPELYSIATCFHRELSTLFLVDTIITTNWDNYFEIECGAIPFVTAQDFVFWNVPGRKVFKFHGSINNYGSLIVTVEDFKKCYKKLREGILGSTIKHIIGTKTVIYFGYSFKDEDFIKIHSMINEEMGELLPHGYIVTLDRDSDERFRRLNLSPIHTDATNFISVIKSHIIIEGLMLDDDNFNKIFSELITINEEHSKLHDNFNLMENPDILYTSAYQDGLIHSFERMLQLKYTGYYSNINNIYDSISIYNELRKSKNKIKKYFDVAYIDGYLNGLYFFIFEGDGRKFLPHYYIFGLKDQPRTFDNYIEKRIEAPKIHKTAYKSAIEIVSKEVKSKDNVYHHRPFLL